MENLDDKKCIDAINDSIFSSYYSFYPVLSFSKMLNHLLKRYSYHGQNGFHKGFGDIMANLLIKEIKKSSHGHMRPDKNKPFRLVNRVLRVHTAGINDKSLNKTILRLIH